VLTIVVSQSSQPIVQTALAALSLAKHEILWYFHHQTHAGLLKKPIVGEFVDDKIWELIFAVNQLSLLVSSLATVIRTYYLKSLRGPDSRKFQALVSNLTETKPVDNSVAQTLTAIIATLQVANDDTDFEALRLDWERIEAFISDTAAATGPITNVTELLIRGNLIHQRTEYACCNTITPNSPSNRPHHGTDIRMSYDGD
jgi:hypothetical protein